MSEFNVAVLVGSLRKESFNRKVAHALSDLAPASLKLTIVEIGDLPFYNEDLDAGTAPEAWTNFRNKIKGMDAVLFVTPEYNRSVPAVLKNALDVGSRPYGKNVWDGKPGGVVSVSMGAIGGFGSNHHVRQSLVFLNVPVLQQPEAYLGGISNAAFDDQGKLTDERTKKFLANYIDAYARWVARLAK